MTARIGLEERLDQLSELRRAPLDGETHDKLARALGEKSPHLVAKAAQIVAERGVSELIPQLVAAFERLLVDAVKSDRGCVGKTAIAKALLAMEQGEEDVFLAGCRHVQNEPSYGGPTDTAVELRSTSALGLASTSYPDTALVLVDLLVDPETPVRLAATEALYASGRLEAEALLRLKARQGDSEPEVLTHCLQALLKLEPRRSLPFVASYLESGDEEHWEAAVLALGESRFGGALEPLTRQWELRVDLQSRKTLAVALASQRREAAYAFLLSRLASAGSRLAAGILHALALHRHDAKLREEVKSVVERRGEDELLKVYERDFAP